MAASISLLLSKPLNYTASPLSSKTSIIATSAPILNDKNHHTPKFSCTANNKNNYTELNRRDVLLGLGGLSSAALALSSNPLAQADPYPLPDLSTCHRIANYDPKSKPPTNCCPPYKLGDKFTEFVLPDSKLPLRLRPAAQLVDGQYLDRFKKALRLMMDLPDSDPRSFRQQANVHCAYCEGGYTADGKPTQVHFTWLFLPWHRFYLYFFEKILGNMIEDDLFAIPFWNWDAPGGMRIPQIYKDRTSPLYDAFRNEGHLCALINLNYDNPEEVEVLDEQRIRENLSIMHRQILDNGAIPQAFLGFPFKYGSELYDMSGMGQLENIPHNKVHRWTGDSTQAYNEDMGRFYSAARDPIFYAHHANVDRLWDVWKTLVWEPNKPEFDDKDWLDSTFLFFNENAELKSVKVSDSLNSTRFRYNYVDVSLDWVKTPPVLKTTKETRRKRSAVPITELTNFPITLSSTVTTRATRPEEVVVLGATSKKKEFLVVDGIEVEENTYATFDVYINTPDDHAIIGPDAREMAGSFGILPHHHKVRTSIMFGLNAILKELEAEEDESILVTLVPRAGVGSVKIGGMHIQLFD